MKKSSIIRFLTGFLCMLILTSCSASKTSKHIETLVYDMFTAPVEYMEENHELFRGFPLGEGVPTPSQEEIDALNAQVAAATEEFESLYDHAYAYCTESGVEDFFSAMTDMQWTAAEFSIPVEVQSVTVEILSEKNNTFRYKAELLINNNQQLEVAGKMQTDTTGMITYIDAREAMGAVMQVISVEING